MKLKKITEGKTDLYVPLVPVDSVVTKKDPIFYNPEMEIARDLSVVCAKVLGEMDFCDSLAGTGARGIRIANEVKYKNVIVNDKNPNAVKLIKKNAKLNGVEVIVSNLSVNILLNMKKCNWIDIDPFGPPVKFTDSGVRTIPHNGILSITATDTAPLSGTYPKACRRKYDAIPLRTDYFNEVGLRILLGYLARSALKYDKIIEPLFSYSRRHYVRTYLRIKKSRSRTSFILNDNIRFLQHCFNCMNRELRPLGELKEKCSCGKNFTNAGPLWNGNFADENFCNDLNKILINENFRYKHDEIKLVELVRKEQKVDNPYYDIHKVFKKLKIPSISMEYITKKLKNKGFTVKRTHFSKIGLRTDAKIDNLYEILK